MLKRWVEVAGVYIHIPFCTSKCRYCDFTSYPGKIGFAEAYMACVYKEIKLRAGQLKDKVFDTVYFGGGTPSVIDEKLIAGCVRQLKKYLLIAEDAEITIEVNPGTLTKEKVSVYREAGINRFSIGLQSAENRLLEDLGRIHTAEDFVSACRMIGGCNKSADIMIGLKDQSWDDVKKTIDLACVSCGVKHISVYALTPEDGTPVYTDYLNGELPDSDEVAEMYDRVREYLSPLGYRRYEVSNFALAGYESRHNLNYWRRGEYIGFGVAACSFMNGRRFANTRDLDEYIKCILTDYFPVVDDEDVADDAAFEKIMLALRTEEGLSLTDFNREFSTDFETEFADALKKNARFLELKDGRLKIKDNFLYVQNTIIIDFLQK